MSEKESPEEAPGVSGGTGTEPPAGAAGRAGTERRRHWPAVTAVTASVVLLAGALYGGGALLAARDGSADGGPDPLVLDDLGGTAARNGVDAAMEADTSMPAYHGIVYEAAGELPEGPDSAPVHRFTGEVDGDTVAGLARALGVKDPLEEKDGYWTAGSGAGTRDPMLVVTEDDTGQWHLTSYPLEPEELLPDLGAPDGADSSVSGPEDLEAREREIAEAEKAEAEKAEAAGRDAAEPVEPVEDLPAEPGPGEEDGFGLEDAPEPENVPAGPPVSEEEALAAVRPALEVLGLAGAPADASDAWGDVRTVMVQDEVGGLPVYGSYTFFEVGPEGRVTGGWGTLAKTTAGEEYPLIGAAEALELLNEQQTMWASAPALRAGPEAGTEAGTEPAEPAGEPAAPAPETVAVTGAELGLSLHYSQGEPLLVPAWLFRGDTGKAESGHVAGHPAVDPGYLAGPDTGADGDADGTDAGFGGSGGADSGEGQSQPGSKGSAGDAAPDPGEGGGDVAEPEPGEAPEDTGVYVETYRPEDTVLVYHHWTGVCGTYTTTAEETATTVTLRVEHSGVDEDTACIMIAEETVHKVELAKPVGDRTVLDESGNPVPVR
ncbi:hypothetical protein [Streptomyces sp. YIM 98790]|uniref:hypothetical protein n=1 Tax=Streptomyces sp. YIM 98790 TaxID=2689077 RepID=UPI00140DE7A7|nr:hypothetical protein [Streptomyces sp. YIM 98790]